MTPPPLILVGIDEAGYGPMLGPLCVGMTAFRVPRPAPDQPPVPCLWTLLDQGICREPGRGGKPDARGRVAIADSKRLKLASAVKTTHPLVHLERGVWACARACASMNQHTRGDAMLPDDDALLTALGARWPDLPWYRDDPTSLPLASTRGSLALASATLEAALHARNVSVLHMGCRVIGEREFNALARAHPGGKAATTAEALQEFFAHAWQQWGHVGSHGATSLGIVCDRQGGRAAYAGVLTSALPGCDVEVVEESDHRSRYVLRGVGPDGLPRRAGVAFLVEAEQHHVPVALASMIAKLTRELAMLRFNRWWEREAAVRGMRDLKPTAGYALDAQRWLRDMRSFLTDQERDYLVRVV